MIVREIVIEIRNLCFRIIYVRGYQNPFGLCTRGDKCNIVVYNFDDNYGPVICCVPAHRKEPQLSQANLLALFEAEEAQDAANAAAQNGGDV